MKYPVYIQSSQSECGPACIKMIMEYYGSYVEIKEIKEKAKTSEEATSIYGMIQALEAYHFQSKAIRCDQLGDLSFPCIVLTCKDNMYHYVVLYRRFYNYLLLCDPASGLKIVKEKDFLYGYQKSAIIIEHAGRNDMQASTLPVFLSRDIWMCKKEIIFLTMFSFIVFVLSLLYAYLFNRVLNHPLLWVFVVLAATEVMKNLLVYIEEQCKSRFIIKKKEIYELRTLQQYLYHPLSIVHDPSFMQFRSLEQFSEALVQFEAMLFYDGIFLLAGFLFLGIQDFWLLLWILAAGIFLLVMAIVFSKYLDQAYQRVYAKHQKKEELYHEMMENFDAITMYRQKKFMKLKILDVLNRYNDENKDYQKILNIYSILMQCLMHLTIIIALMMVKENLAGMYILLSFMMEPFVNIINGVVSYAKIQIFYERYKQTLTKKGKRKKKIKKIHSIKIHHVDYSYHYGNLILHDCNLEITRSLYLSGGNGSGKSTLLKLMMGYDEVEKGEILINDMDISKIDCNSLYRRMIYLKQHPVFFKESLRYNLLLDSHEEITMIYLLKIFSLERLLPLLDTTLDEQGSQLSSGERQAVMIIRALLLKPDVLILDEALSHIDAGTKRKILHYALDSFLVIFVSHQTNVVDSDFECAIMEEINGGSV